MSSRIPDMEDLELISADSSPTYEGSIWISLQAVEHIFNSISERDTFTNSFTVSYLTEILEKFNGVLRENSLRPFPQDEIFQLMRFSRNALYKILENSRNTIYKEEKMVHAYKAKSLDSKAMMWLGKQPGRNLQEKIAVKNKVLCKESRYTYETKENQVVSKFVKMLLIKIRNRVEAVNADCYDTLESDCRRWDEFEEFQNSLESKFKKSPLAGIDGYFDYKPNNVLINDRNYSIIWRAYKQLASYNAKFKDDWQMISARFRNCIFYGIASELYSVKGVYLADILTLTKDFESNIGLFYEEALEEITVNKIKFLVLSEKKESTSEIILELSEETLKVVIKSRETEKNISYRIKKKEKTQLEKNRGMGIVLSKTSQGIPVKEWSLNSCSDMKGLKIVIEKLVNEILLESRQPKKRKEAAREISDSQKYVGIDFTSYTPKISSEKSTSTEDGNLLYAVESVWGGEKNISLCRADTFYSKSVKIIPMREVFSSESSIHFTKIVEFLKDKLRLEDEEYFCYVVPDGVDEFSQKLLKASIIPYFKKSFPVWRSIAAAVWWSGEKNPGITPGDELTVIDTHGERISAVKLKAKMGRGGKIIFEHYPVLPSEDSDSGLSYDSFIREYIEALSLPLSSDEVEMILNSGAAERLIKERRPQLFYNGEQYFELRYRHDIYKKLSGEWYEKLKKYSALKKGENNIKSRYTLFLGDFLSEGEFIINSKNTAAGASEISRRLKKGEETWLEYLPDLSLEITRNGHYGELAIVKDKTVTPVYGEEVIIKVEENMILNKGKRYYRFPLIKQENSGNAQDIEASISSKYFPLERDIAVRLEIKYKYGLENSYELRLIPLTGELPFKELPVEWIKEQSKEHNVQLKMPEQEVLSEAVLEKEITWFSNKFDHLAGKFYWNHDTAQVVDFINRNKNRIRKLAANNDESVKRFMNSETTAIFLGSLFNFSKSYEENPQDFSGIDYNRKKPQDAVMKFFCAFGKYAYEHIVEECFRGEKLTREKADYIGLLISGNYRIDMAGKLYMNFKNSDNELKRKIVGIISDNVKQDIKFLENLFSDYPEMAKLMIKFIEMDLKALRDTLKKKGKSLEKNDKRWQITEPFRRYCELIIFLLASRNSTPLLKEAMPLERMQKLAKNIRKIDAMLFCLHQEDESIREGRNVDNWKLEPKIKIKVQKPDALKNVSDIVFVLNSNLTGEGGDNLIEITEIDEKD